MGKASYRSCILLLTLVLLLAGTAFSQDAQSGAISGYVQDPMGALIGKATVTVVNNSTQGVERTVSTTGYGLFSATLLPPGEYTVTVKAPGFKTFSQKISVLLNQTSHFEATLQVGNATEIIEVTATTAMINTESAVTGTPINSATMRALPLPIPNFMFLLSLSAGTAGEMPDVRLANRGIVDINVNGQRTSNNNVSLEGINVNDFNLAHFDTIPLPNPHVIEEFNVATSLYDGASGDKGGGSVGLVFKSGTKDWHGEAYWQHRNDFLNANEWFSNQKGLPRGKFLQNVLGFSGSGPVPVVVGSFFGNVQGLRARNAVNPLGSSTNVTSPNFPTNPDGTTSAALLTARYGVANIDPTALNILNLKSSAFAGGPFLIPRAGQTGCVPSGTGGVNLSCTFRGVAPLEDTQYVTVYDRSFHDGKSKISGRWFYDNGNATLPFATASTLAFPQEQTQNNRFATISHTQEISSRQLNVVRLGFSRFLSSFIPTDIVSLASINATRPNSSTIPGVYQVAVTGAFSFGTGVNDDRATVSNTFDANDTWSVMLGKHTLKVGGGATHYQLNRLNRFGSRGSLAFANFNQFLAGQINNVTAASGDPQRYFRATDFGAFFEDDYKIRPNLTLNLGVRWDSMEFAHDLLERTSTFDPSLVPNANPFLLPSNSSLPGITGTPGVGSCGSRTCRSNGNIGPRAGFSWSPFHDAKTVVRGGYGIYYQRLSNQNFLQGSLGPPFFQQIAIQNPGTSLANPLPNLSANGGVATAFIPQNSHFAGIFTPPNSGGTPGDVNDQRNVPLFVNDQNQACLNFGGTATNCSINLASFSSVPPNAKVPYNQQWNFGLQRELGQGWGKGWILELDYVGSHYLRGLGTFAPFLAALASPSNPITVTDTSGVAHTITVNTVGNEPLRMSAIGLDRRQGARVLGNVGYAIYHSGQLTLSHRFSKGLYFQSAYTYSKEIDNVSGSQSTDELNATQAGQLGANMANFGNLNPALNRSIGDFDRRNRFVLSYVYELPVPKNGIWGTQGFQGWSISGINTFQDGLPFSVTDPTGGRAFGGGTSTGIFNCSSISSAYNPGSVQDQIAAGLGYLNQSCFLPSPVVGVANNDPTRPQLNVPVTGYGNVPRNAFRGPFQQAWDFALAKKLRLRERQAMDFRVDAFNVLNHPSFKQPAFVGIGTAALGQINNTVSPARLLQLNVQYSF